MPRLLFFVVCQKSIIDRDSGELTMIGTVNGVRFLVPESTPIPPDAVIAYSWAAICSWLRLPEDEGKTFDQRLEIRSPSGHLKGFSEIPLVLTTKTYNTNSVSQTFPGGEAGEYSLVLLLRESGSSEWKEIATYPLDVIHESALGNPPPDIS